MYKLKLCWHSLQVNSSKQLGSKITVDNYLGRFVCACMNNWYLPNIYVSNMQNEILGLYSNQVYFAPSAYSQGLISVLVIFTVCRLSQFSLHLFCLHLAGQNPTKTHDCRIKKIYTKYTGIQNKASLQVLRNGFIIMWKLESTFERSKATELIKYLDLCQKVEIKSLLPSVHAVYGIEYVLNFYINCSQFLHYFLKQACAPFTNLHVKTLCTCSYMYSTGIWNQWFKHWRCKSCGFEPCHSTYVLKQGILSTSLLSTQVLQGYLEE